MKWLKHLYHPPPSFIQLLRYADTSIGVLPAALGLLTNIAVATIKRRVIGAQGCWNQLVQPHRCPPQLL